MHTSMNCTSDGIELNYYEQVGKIYIWRSILIRVSGGPEYMVVLVIGKNNVVLR